MIAGVHLFASFSILTLRLTIGRGGIYPFLRNLYFPCFVGVNGKVTLFGS